MSSPARLKYFVVTIAMMASLLVVLIPLPPAIIDILLSINITMAVLVMLTTISVGTPLEFAIFPSLLLVATLGRLVLNVATTRLILTRAGDHGVEAAGGIVRAFGEFVAGDQVVVGIIIFAIIVCIQFLVITKGASRISEVGSRFALDGMPGRQMAIDADLNAGTIDAAQARLRREELARQADFYGAMDGASKFVRGDAVAGIVITAINIVGGLLIGVGQGGMTLSEATSVFTRLTIGDGLVSQIPAFLIALAAGLLITRSSQRTEFPTELLNQVLLRPQTLAVAAGFLAILAFTGLPALPLLIIACGCAGLGIAIVRDKDTDADKKAEPAPVKVRSERRVEDCLRIDPLDIELGIGLLKLADPQRGGDLLEKIALLRNQVATDLGLLLPKVRIRDNMGLDEHGYRINLLNNRLASGTVLPHRLLAVDMGRATGVLDGIPDRDPITNRPAMWIESTDRSETESLGFVVNYPVDVIVAHLRTVVRRNADELLTRDATKHLIEELRRSAPVVVEELVPDVMRLSDVQLVLKRLLHEGVSIRQLSAILETLGDHAREQRDPRWLAERVRVRLARTLSSSLRDRHGVIHAVTLDPDLEQSLLERLGSPPSFRFEQLPTYEVQLLRDTIARQCASLRLAGQPEVLAVVPQLRLPLRDLNEKSMPDLHVISFQEISRDTRVQSTAVIALTELLQQAG